MHRLLAAALLLAGCSGVDPCDGLSGACISARVEGSATGLDALRVTIAGGGTMLSAPGGTFDLPVRLAIVLPAGTASPADLTVEGLTGGTLRASSGAQRVSFSSSGKTPYTFTLSAGGPMDGGSGDGPPPGVVSFFPTSIDYGTANRGSPGAVKSVTLSNNTDHTVTMVGDPNPTGDGDAWNLTPATTCFALDGGMGGMGATITVPAGMSCAISFQFVPPRSGALSMNLAATFDDGETASFTLTGNAMRAWTVESAGMSNLTSVWGAASNNVWAGATTPILHTQGTGTWASFGSGVGTTLSAIFGADATHLWISVDGKLFTGDGTGAWTQQTILGGTVGFPTAGWARDATDAFAVTDAPNPEILRLASGQWSQLLTTPSAHPFTGICGFGNTMIAVGYNATVYATDSSGTFQNLGAILGASYGANLHGCWMSDLATGWVVGDGGPGIIGIFKCSVQQNVWSCQHESAGNDTNALSAIAGRIDPATHQPDIYAVGAQGNQILHSDGSGTWTSIGVPGNQAMNAVWVAPNGDVYAGGFGGQINHWY